MPIIASLRVVDLKRLLREKNLATVGTKAELVQRLTDAVGSDEIEFDVSPEDDDLRSEIDSLRGMVENLTALIKRQMSANVQPSNTVREEHSPRPPVVLPNEEPRQRNMCSVREIAETLPEYDPTKDAIFSVEQFIDRVGKVMAAYQWDERCLLLAVYAKLKGPAKLWLDASAELYVTWRDLSAALKEEFGTVPDEADIHFKMSNTTRKTGETVSEYCFKMSALGKRHNLSESAVIKYTREGLKHRELQLAIATVRFRSMKEMRETVEEYFSNIASCSSNGKTSTVSKRGEYGGRSAYRPHENVIKTEMERKPIVCFNCSEAGHISSACPKPQRRARCKDCQRVHPRGTPENCGKPNAKTSNVVKKQPTDKRVIINGINLLALIDTGSECSMVKRSKATSLSGEIKPCYVRVSGVCGGSQVLREMIKATLIIDDVKLTVDLYIADDDMFSPEVIIGNDVFGNNTVNLICNDDGLKFENRTARTAIARRANEEVMNIKHGATDENTRSDLFQLVDEHRKVFGSALSEIGLTNAVEMEIKLSTNQPVTRKCSQSFPETEETSHKTVEGTEPSYEPQSTPKVRVRFSDSNETHEYEEEEPYTGLDESTRLTAGSAVQQEGQGDTTNNEFFEQFRQALFAALQLKAQQHQHQTHECTSDATLTPTPKESTAVSNIENNNSIYSQADLQEKSDLIKTRLAELEKEIKTFKENNVMLLKAKQDHELEKSLNAQEHLEAMERINDEKIRMEIYLHDERVKLEDEKRQFEQQTKLKTQGQIAKERKECERLRDQVSKLETQLKTKDSNHTSAQARLRTQIRNLEREQAKLHEQIEQLTKENKRLENENLKISREQNNKILMEINRNIAKLAPKQIQNSTTTIPEEGPPTLGVTKTVSKCIVAAATANKNACKAHKGTNTNFTTGKPLSNTNKYCSSSAMDKPTQAINCPEIIIEEDDEEQQEYHQQTQDYHQQYIYENDDEDILKELESTPPKRNHNLLSIPQPGESPKHTHNGKTTSMKSNSKREPEIPAPPPSSPRLSSGCNTTMKREIVNEDGSKDIWYPNGNLKKISADGMIIRMLYYNKDIKETNINEGTVRYYYAETNTWHTSYLDGLEILEFPNGQVEHRHKNGIVEVHYPNNSIKIVDPKDEHKQEEWRFPDGTHLVQMRNGDKILSLPNGQKEIHNKLHKRREYPDGTVKLVYPDGSTETRYSNGRVRLKDKDGKLVMDTDMSK